MTAITPEMSARRIAKAPAHYRWMAGGPEARFAVISGARTVKEALAYLPAHYGLMESYEVDHGDRRKLVVIIGGLDKAGWTLDGYIIPRLASGLMGCSEIVA